MPHRNCRRRDGGPKISRRKRVKSVLGKKAAKARMGVRVISEMKGQNLGDEVESRHMGGNGIHKKHMDGVTLRFSVHTVVVGYHKSCFC